MHRAAFRLVARGHQRHSPPQATPCQNMRLERDEHILRARERIFGPQGNMPGDRYFRKKLEGRQLMKWYFPSKYGLQDFRNDEYFEMQADRFAPRPIHRSIELLSSTTEEVAKHREELRRFFENLDEETFLNTPTLHDLYGVFRMVDPAPVLSFPVAENIFLEHSPMWGASPPFKYPSHSGHASQVEDEPAATASGHEEMPEELLALWALISERLKKKGGDALANTLDVRINMVQSEEEIRTMLLEEAHQLGIVAPFKDSTVVVEEARGKDGKVKGSRLAAYMVRPESGGSKEERARSRAKAEEDLTEMKTEGDVKVRDYVNRRHRFVDPMFRRRRLKWLERQMAGKNKETEVKFNSYYATHPDEHKVWPTNKGSVTVVWPSPHH